LAWKGKARLGKTSNNGGLAKNMKPWFFETNIEKIFREELQSRGLVCGIDFIIQYPLRYSFILDIAFPDQKLAIELDGAYWHSRKKHKRRDRMKDSILQKQGWTVIRFSDKEILENVSRCVDFVLKKIKE